MTALYPRKPRDGGIDENKLKVCFRPAGAAKQRPSALRALVEPVRGFSSSGLPTYMQGLQPLHVSGGTEAAETVLQLFVLQQIIKHTATIYAQKYTHMGWIWACFFGCPKIVCPRKWMERHHGRH